MLCLLLIFQEPQLPDRLAMLSPWLDWLVTPRDELFARLAAQHHRRVIKTHTPLDGVPMDDRATYIVVARHPLDMAVSLYHQGDNIDRDRWRALTGQPAQLTPASARPDLRDWLLGWIEQDADPREDLDSLPGVLLHLSDAWARRAQPNVILAHYADLSADLDAAMRAAGAPSRHRGTRGSLAGPGRGGFLQLDARPCRGLRARSGGCPQGPRRVLPPRHVRRRSRGAQRRRDRPLPRPRRRPWPSRRCWPGSTSGCRAVRSSTCRGCYQPATGCRHAR